MVTVAEQPGEEGDDEHDREDDGDLIGDGAQLPELPSLADTDAKKLSERQRDAERKRKIRAAGSSITIPKCKNPKRRAACLADPVLFLQTYFGPRFKYAFATHHIDMIETIIACARDGGDQAIAAPRGDGKSQIAVHMLAYVILKQYVRFPVIVASTRKLADGLFSQFKGFWSKNKLLLEDFPEICVPVRELEGAPSRAARQNVNGENTYICWTADKLRFPVVPRSPYGGVCLMFFGLDSAIRGVHDEGNRPDFILIDDPETPDVAKNDEQNAKIEQMIDSDIAGLGAGDSHLARVILTTIQNCHCYSYRVTDTRIKSSWNGRRHAMLAKWPDCWSDDAEQKYWHEYIALRERDQSKGDKYGKTATAFYLANQAAMDAGAIITNENRYSRKTNPAGELIEHTALQAFFNRVCDWKLPRVLAELQNNPEEEEQVQTAGLTAGLVASRLSGFMQNEAPLSVECFTVGLDLGDRYCHWVKVGWWGRAIGCVVDYGVMETHGLGTNPDTKAIQHALLNAFPGWRTDMLSENSPLLALVDSGDGQHSDAVYKFCREAGSPFFPSKGYAQNRFHMGSASETRALFLECYANVQNPKTQDAFWLYNVNTEYWKGWLQERFLTRTFDDSQLHNDGSLSLFSPPKGKQDLRLHFSFSQHIVAEERQTFFQPGKGTKIEWYRRNKNNHYLDALALACAAAGCVGIRLTRDVVTESQSKPASPQPAPRRESRPAPVFTNPHGQPFLVTQR